jgi:hypothetical protein
MYKNGKTALRYVADEIDASIKDIDASTKHGFPGCPKEGVEFHFAIARATKAGLMWQGIQVSRSIETEKATSEETQIEYQGIFGKMRAQGINAMTPILKFAAIVIVGAVLLYGIKTWSKLNSRLDKINEIELMRMAR